VVCVTQDPPEAVRADRLYGSAPVTVIPSAQAVFAAYDIPYTPHTVFFDRGGAVKWDYEGNDPAMLDAIERALQQRTDAGL
jgi:hypothetical protein